MSRGRSSSYTLIVIGLLLVMVALVRGKWPADFVNANRGQLVTHQQRLLGEDLPPGVEEVERRPGYLVFRVMDALLYLALAQVMVGLIALFRHYDVFFVGMIALAGLYGMIYAAQLGLVVGPQLSFTGFSFIFVASGLELLSNWIRASHYGTHSAA